MRLLDAAQQTQDQVLAVGLDQKDAALVDALREQIAKLHLHLRMDVEFRLLDSGDPGTVRVERSYDDR